MPQKKNPDMAELIRGKSGRVFGDLVTMLTVMKGLPLAYNKDMQEDKEALFDAADTVRSCLEIAEGMMRTTKFKTNEMQKKLSLGFMNATDAADYLAHKGVPFREAHRIIGQLVAYAEKKGKPLEELTLGEFRKLSKHFDDDIFAAIDYKTVAASKR
jgi:argininosuccinate lyase